MFSDKERHDVQKRICTGLMHGKSLTTILKETKGMPSRETVYVWLYDDKAFADDYARAREAQADYYAEQITDIADTESDPDRARVRIDARKWAAGKMKPKSYGDKVTNELVGKDGAALVPVINVTVGRDQSKPTP